MTLIAVQRVCDGLGSAMPTAYAFAALVARYPSLPLELPHHGRPFGRPLRLYKMREFIC